MGGVPSRDLCVHILTLVRAPQEAGVCLTRVRIPSAGPGHRLLSEVNWWTRARIYKQMTQGVREWGWLLAPGAKEEGGELSAVA